MNILNYSREQIVQMFKDGLCGPQVLRDWEIAKAKESGERVTNIAFDNNVHRTTVYRRLKKAQGRV